MFCSVDHMRHGMYKIQNKDLSIGSYKINKIYLSFYNDKKIYT